MSPDPNSRFEPVAVEILGRLEGGEPVDEADYARRYPAFAEEIRELLAVERLLRGTVPSAEGESLADSAPDAGAFVLGDFRVGRLIGQGGMGRVYEAEQLSLRRKVALKVLDRGLLTAPESIERFRRGASAAASLSHPNIVPVYSFGEASGVLYVAMELIEGRTLADVISSLSRLGRVAATEAHFAAAVRGEPLPTAGAAPASRSSAGTRAYFADLCRLIASVCDGLECAHSAGILHRDLKPANIILRADGSPLIMDFGIARAEGAADLTMAGQFVGTVPYMSRDQLSSKSRVIDRRSDVYSLGVTLYELVTLRRPFDGDTTEQIIARIQTEDPVPPRKIDPRVPEDVETIVQKAMDPSPALRYQSAAEFGADLRRFVERQPIAARPAGPLLKLRRWAERQPALAASVASLFLVLAAGLAATLALWREAREGRSLAEAGWTDANESLKVALDAVDEMLTRVADSTLKDVPFMTTVRGELLQSALRFYQGFLSRRSGDPSLRVDTARAATRVGFIEEQLGRREAGVTHVREALALLDALPQESRSGLEAGLVRADGKRVLAHALAEEGRTDDALEELRATNEACEVLVASHPEDERTKERLSAGLVTRGGIALQAARVDEAEKDLGRALEIQKALAEQDPADARLVTQAVTETFLGFAYHERGRLEEARKTLLDAREHLGAVLARRPGDLALQTNLARCEKALGILDEKAVQWAEAESSYRRSAELFEKLDSLFPSTSNFRRELVGSLHGLGASLAALGRNAEAGAAFDRSVAVAEALLASDPGSFDKEQLVATASLYQAHFASGIGEAEAARRACERAIECFTDLLDRQPGNAIVIEDLANAKQLLAWLPAR